MPALGVNTPVPHSRRERRTGVPRKALCGHRHGDSSALRAAQCDHSTCSQVSVQGSVRGDRGGEAEAGVQRAVREGTGAPGLTSPAGSWPLLAGRSRQPCRRPWSPLCQMPGNRDAHAMPRSITPSAHVTAAVQGSVCSPATQSSQIKVHVVCRRQTAVPALPFLVSCFSETVGFSNGSHSIYLLKSLPPNQNAYGTTITLTAFSNSPSPPVR